ncbi:MAG: hypothetical protein IJI59_00915 [Clostridia bacterium]|nr:hypothetical protein [Clostridia bacterium]
MNEIIRFFAAHNYPLNFDSYTGSQLSNLILYEKDPTAFCTVEAFRKACETMKTFLGCRTESIRRQLAGELSTVSEGQKDQDMVGASGLDLLSLGALVVGRGQDS